MKPVILLVIPTLVACSHSPVERVIVLHEQFCPISPSPPTTDRQVSVLLQSYDLASRKAESIVGDPKISGSIADTVRRLHEQLTSVVRRAKANRSTIAIQRAESAISSFQTSTNLLQQVGRK